MARAYVGPRGSFSADGSLMSPIPSGFPAGMEFFPENRNLNWVWYECVMGAWPFLQVDYLRSDVQKHKQEKQVLPFVLIAYSLVHGP